MVASTRSGRVSAKKGNRNKTPKNSSSTDTSSSKTTKDTTKLYEGSPVKKRKFEERISSGSPSKNLLEKSNPLRRSERIEKHNCSNPTLKFRSNSKEAKERINEESRQTSIETQEQEDDVKYDIPETTRISKKKKLLPCPAYRALFRPTSGQATYVDTSKECAKSNDENKNETISHGALGEETTSSSVIKGCTLAESSDIYKKKSADNDLQARDIFMQGAQDIHGPNVSSPEVGNDDLQLVLEDDTDKKSSLKTEPVNISYVHDEVDSLSATVELNNAKGDSEGVCLDESNNHSCCGGKFCKNKCQQSCANSSPLEMVPSEVNNFPFHVDKKHRFIHSAREVDLDGREVEVEGNTRRNENSAISLPVSSEPAALEKHVIDLKADSLDSKFLEFWVPIHLSHVQLELYCSSLIAGSTILRSCSRDLIEATADILVSTRKCCDHPYLVDGSLQSSLTTGHPLTEYLDIGVHASSKLDLLDKVLLEMKNQGLRAVIIFHQFTGGSVKISMGDILDDFVRQRFGAESYERVESGLSTAKRQASIQMFNNRKNGRFVFLLENRACLSSIKLSMVDAVIIFGSDWNPLNDMKALRKIKFDSQIIKVFRLYSLHTLEENILSLAKEDVYLESNQQSISRRCHSLLCSGANLLFYELDRFHGFVSNQGCLETCNQKPHLNDISLEILTQIADKEGKTNPQATGILKAQQYETTYSVSGVLFGREVKMASEEPAQVFWLNLLEGRSPQWKYIAGFYEKARRKVQKIDEEPLPLKDDARKKRKTFTDTSGPSSSEHIVYNKVEFFTVQSPAKEKYANHVDLLQPDHSLKESLTKAASASEGKSLRSSQRNLHKLLKPELTQLCDILQLPENVKTVAEIFLEYIMNNLHVSQEPVTLLQAFKLSLCWRAATFLKYKLDRRQSLEIAIKELKFECNESEVESIYSKLHMLKKKFPIPINALLKSMDPNHLIDLPIGQAQNNNEKHFNVVTSDLRSSGWREVGAGGRRAIDVLPEDHVRLEQVVKLEPTRTTVENRRGSSEDEITQKMQNEKNDISMGHMNQKQVLGIQDFESFLISQGQQRQSSMLGHSGSAEITSLLPHQVHSIIGSTPGSTDATKRVAMSILSHESSLQKDHSSFLDASSQSLSKMYDIEVESSSNGISGKLSYPLQTIEKSTFQTTSALLVSEARTGISDVPVTEDNVMMEISQTDLRPVLDNELPVVSSVKEDVEHNSSHPTVLPQMVVNSIMTQVSQEQFPSETAVAANAGIPALPSLEQKQTVPAQLLVNSTGIQVSQRQLDPEILLHFAAANSQLSTLPTLEQEQSVHPSTLVNSTGINVSQEQFSPNTVLSCAANGQLPALPTWEQEQAAVPPILVSSIGIQVLQEQFSPENVLQCASNCQVAVLPTLEQEQSLCNESLIQKQNAVTSVQDILSIQPQETQQDRSESQVPINDDLINSHVVDEPVSCSESFIQNQNQLPNILSNQHLNVQENQTGSESAIAFDLRSTDIQQERADLFQPIITQLPSQGIDPDPMKNEMWRISKEIELVAFTCDNKKFHLKSEFEHELGNLIRKYNLAVQNVEKTYLERTKKLRTIYNKVLRNQILASEFRSKFSNNKAGVANSENPQDVRMATSQHHQVSHALSAQAAIPSSCNVYANIAVSSSSVVSLNDRNPHSFGVPTQARVVTSTSTSASVPPVRVFHQTDFVTSNYARPPITSAALTLPSTGTNQPPRVHRSAPPHLHSFRPSTSMSSLPPTCGVRVGQSQLPPTNPVFQIQPVLLRPQSFPSCDAGSNTNQLLKNHDILQTIPSRQPLSSNNSWSRSSQLSGNHTVSNVVLPTSARQLPSQDESSEKLFTEQMNLD